MALPDTSRVYLIASAQHGPGALPPAEGGASGNDGLYPTNPNDFRPAIRALVHALDQWVAEGVEPPPSRYPRIADGTLVDAGEGRLAAPSRACASRSCATSPCGWTTAPSGRAA